MINTRLIILGFLLCLSQVVTGQTSVNASLKTELKPVAWYQTVSTIAPIDVLAELRKQTNSTKNLTNSTATNTAGLPPISSKDVWVLYRADISSGNSWLTKTNPLFTEYSIFIYNDALSLVSSGELGLYQKGLFDRPKTSRQSLKIQLTESGAHWVLVKQKNRSPQGNQLFIVTEAGHELSVNQTRDTAILTNSIAIALFLFNLVLLIGYPDKTFSWFLALHAVLLVYFNSLYGFSHYMLPQKLVIALGSHIMTLNMLLIFLIYQFGYHLLNTFQPIRTVRQHNQHKFLQLLIILTLCASLILDDTWVMTPFLISITGLFALILRRAFRYYNMGFKPALLLVIAVFFQVIGGLIGTAAFSGFLPHSQMNLMVFFGTSVIELLIMVYALATRSRFLEVNRLRTLQIDPLTGAANVTYLNTELSNSWEQLRKQASPIQIIGIRFNGFNEIARNLGPVEADKKLRRLILAIEHHFSENPDVIELPKVDMSFCAYSKYRYLIFTHSSINIGYVQKCISSVIEKQNQSAQISFRLGYYQCSNGSEKLNESIRKVMVALDLASQDASRIGHYDHQLDEQFKLANMVKLELHQALLAGQLQAYIQPQYDIQTEKVIGGELLVRWFHPRLGLIRPDQFIPLAEQLNMITEVSRFMVDQCRQLMLSLRNRESMTFSVNLSTIDLLAQEFVDDLCSQGETLAKTGHKFCLEITESVLINQPDRALKTLDRFRSTGYMLSLDDFGTGYSSLTYLSQILPDEVKIDRSFVNRVTNSKADANIVLNVVRLSESLGAICVAEGIENKTELDNLSKINCSKGQGFYWSKPMPINKFNEWLQQQT